MRRRLHVEFHEIDESCASGNRNCSGAMELHESIILIAGLRKREGLHIVTFAYC
jgi:hypothetical protein